MNRRSTWVTIGLSVLVFVAVVWGAGGYIWRWLLALHGKH
jgi:hypothetical protein